MYIYVYGVHRIKKKGIQKFFNFKIIVASYVRVYVCLCVSMYVRFYILLSSRHADATNVYLKDFMLISLVFSTWFADWGHNIDVVGFCFLDLASNYVPPESLVEWLDLDNKPRPIYIGFGSLVSFLSLLFLLDIILTFWLEKWHHIQVKNKNSTKIYLI